MSTYAATEAQFMAAVRELAALTGWKTLHIYDARRSSGGFPDLLMARCGRLIAAELKSERGVVRPEQTEWLRVLEAAGAETFIWRPSSWPEIEQVLR